MNPIFDLMLHSNVVVSKVCIYTKETISTVNSVLTKSNAHLQCFLEQSDDVGVNSGRRLEAEGKGKGEGRAPGIRKVDTQTLMFLF